jgi:hypothetical protein
MRTRLTSTSIAHSSTFIHSMHANFSLYSCGSMRVEVWRQADDEPGDSRQAEDVRMRHELSSVHAHGCGLLLRAHVALRIQLLLGRPEDPPPLPHSGYVCQRESARVAKRAGAEEERTKYLGFSTSVPCAYLLGGMWSPMVSAAFFVPHVWHPEWRGGRRHETLLSDKAIIVLAKTGMISS